MKNWDVWYLWPDDFMLSKEEFNESEYCYRSDDYELVVVTEYDKNDWPCKWVPIKEYEKFL